MSNKYWNSDIELSFEDGGFPKIVNVCKIRNVGDKSARAMHVHPDRAEIVYICKGESAHIIDSDIYTAKTGDLLIYNQGIQHDERISINGSVEYYSCGINGIKIKGLQKNFLIQNDIVPVMCCGDYANKVESIFKLIYDGFGVPSNNSSEIIEYLMSALVSLCLKIIRENGRHVGKNNYDTSRRIKQYIDSNYLKDISLSMISQEVGISQFYLTRLFKEKTGYAPLKYIINRRMGDAQSLLISTDMTVSKIAEAVGYDNPNYFNLLFKKTVGITPGKYRKHILGMKIGD